MFDNQVKIIFVDIDGTLRNDKREITQASINAVNELEKNNVLVVLTSGRPRKYVEDIARKVGASRFIITSNGAEIYNYMDDDVVYSKFIDKASILEVCEIAKKNKLHYVITSGDKRYVNYINKNSIGNERVIEDINKEINEMKPVQIVVSETDYNKVEAIRKDIENMEKIYPVNMHKSLIDSGFERTGTIYYDLVKNGVSKGIAINFLTKYLGMQLSQVAAIGDSENDIEMIKIARIGIAMGNATENLKKEADWITNSNTNEGFGHATKIILQSNKKMEKKIFERKK